PPARAVLGYLRDCHEADRQEQAVLDILDERVQHLRFVSGREELLRGGLDRLPVDPDLFLPAQKAAQLYEREKTLVYCAFFVTGAAPAGEHLPAHLCAPLLVHPAKIIESEVAGEPFAFLTLDPGQQRINARAVAALLGQSEADSAALDDLLG